MNFMAYDFFNCKNYAGNTVEFIDYGGNLLGKAKTKKGFLKIAKKLQVAYLTRVIDAVCVDVSDCDMTEIHCDLFRIKSK